MPKCIKNYRDKIRAKQSRNRWRDKNYKAGVFFINTKKWKRYSEEEIKLILEHKTSDRKIAELLDRSVRSIQNTRHKYKKEKII
jgi:hypothetical protein